VKKICVIGHFGFGQNLLNGQTVKTKIITEEIERRFGKDSVILLDLAGGVKRIPNLLIQIPHILHKCSHVVIMPVENGLRFLTPVLNFWSPFFKSRKIHYVVIGGWLPQFLTKRKSLSKILRKFDGIYVETNTMKSALEAQGFENIYVMPNCKKLTVLSENELVYPSGVPYKLCTFSRVMKEKGIENALNAVKEVNEKLGRTVYTLDIYGQVDTEQTEWFDNLQNNFPPYVKYMGVAPFDKSVDVLKNYFALLFPTYYEGEGFAGTLIDAYSAGVPVIASDWKYNAELVNENAGFVYPTGDQLAFAGILKETAADPTLLLCKKRTCLIEADKYRIDKAVRVLIEQLEDD
jgi:glycosyltransferase involved in cell wall biosynthesis